MTDNSPLSAVFDTGVILQAVLNIRGPAAQALALLDEGKIRLFMSSRIRSEIEAVLYRPAIRAKNPLLTDEIILAVLNRLDTKAIRLDNPPVIVTYSRDPKDEPILNLAIYVEAEVIVSRDNDLLDLMRDDLPDGRFFRKRFPTIEILDPLTFVRKMRAERV